MGYARVSRGGTRTSARSPNLTAVAVAEPTLRQPVGLRRVLRRSSGTGEAHVQCRRGRGFAGGGEPGHGFQPNVLLPDWNAAGISSRICRGWRRPTTTPPSTARLLDPQLGAEARHHTILIDTYVGNHKERPGQPRFHMLNRPYMENFAKAGLKPEDVDYVLCTHLHVDHVGWNTGSTTAAGCRPSPTPSTCSPGPTATTSIPRAGKAARRSTTPACSTTACCRSWKPSRTWWSTASTARRRHHHLAGAGHSPGHVLITLHVEGHRGAVHRRHHAQPHPDLSHALEQRLLLRPGAGAHDAAAHARACGGQGQPPSIPATSPARTSAASASGPAASPTCRDAAEAACWACAAISAARPRLCAPWTASAALGRGCNTYRLS